MTPFESLIGEFSKETGLSLKADAGDSCSLETDGLVVTLQYRRERGDVAIFAPVSEPGADLPSETFRTALTLACNGEGTRGNFLGLFGDALILSAFVPFEGLTAATLGDRVLAFADAALAVRAALAAPAAEQAAAGAPSAETLGLLHV